VGEVAEHFTAASTDLGQHRLGQCSVVTIEEFIGSQVRCSPASSAVKPSVARIMWSAGTVPRSQTARPGRIACTRVSS
jgi:hypothetical protein